mgnify:CR=1 FL=1
MSSASYLGSGHRLGRWHWLEIGLSHCYRGAQFVTFKGQLNERREEFALLVSDGSATHDQTMRSIQGISQFGVFWNSQCMIDRGQHVFGRNRIGRRVRSVFVAASVDLTAPNAPACQDC